MTTHIPLACSSFLLAILWMDLIFDVQVLPYRQQPGPLPEDVLSSIASYYRRATTTSRPMGHLVAVVMLLLMGAATVRMFNQPGLWSVVALLLAVGPVLLGLLRVYPNAVRLSARSDTALEQSVLARAICRDHLLCFGAMLAFMVLQLLAVVGLV